MKPGGLLAPYREALRGEPLTRRVGWVRQLQGLAVDAQGPDASIGELCSIELKAAADESPRQRARAGAASAAPAKTVLAEVVGIKPGHVTLMPYGSLQGVSSGCQVVALGRQSFIGVGPELLGRVIDGFCQPMDGLAPVSCAEQRSVQAPPLNPMRRPRISGVLETGVRAIDGLLTLGLGQRVGIFAGSGVGKSTLLGMIAKHVRADVNVIALIGERGREVRDFLEKQLGPEGLKRSVVVVATSDQPALARIRAAYAAVTIAEYFRDAGKQVLLTMDSVTRLAMARREVGLSAGEPPTARGYTPSVFAELPQLCERCGTSDSGGSITALMTVLVDGDDLNEPISDSLRAILDGHIVLSRHLAHQGQYPAIDVLKSASRLLPELTSPQEQALITKTVKQIALLERNRQMVDMGAYESGSNPLLDAALALDPQLHDWLRQSAGGVDRRQALDSLAALHGDPAPAHAGTKAGPPPAPAPSFAAPSFGGMTYASGGRSPGSPKGRP